MGRDELRAALDYILNQADEGELEVIVKAVQRRQKDARIFSKIGGMSPERAAKDLAAKMSAQLGATKDSVEGLVRGFVADIIKKNAPGVSGEELDVLVEHYLKAGKDSGASGAAASIPPEAVLDMVKRFVSYGAGAMPPSEQKALWDEMPRWQDAYWKTFSPQVKALVEAFLAGKLGQEQFWSAVMSVLGL